LEKAKELWKQGMSLRKIEKQLRVGEGTIRKKIKIN
jgi:transposase